jgi:hypothetical protein
MMAVCKSAACLSVQTTQQDEAVIEHTVEALDVELSLEGGDERSQSLAGKRRHLPRRQWTVNASGRVPPPLTWQR